MIKQIDLVINWMRVGFVHGVMNTDNIALSGETIDYGPCAFMNTYNPKTVFSSIDYMGRYSYLNQSIIMQWNLARFAETLIPLIDENKKKSVNLASEIIEEFDKIYNKKWLSMMKKKLGLFGKFSEDKEIVNGLLILMEKHSADFTNTFAFLKCKDLPKIDFFNNYAFKNWHKKWKERLKKNNRSEDEAYGLMKSVNPEIIPRNKLVEIILDDVSSKNFSSMNEFINVYSKPYAITDNINKYQFENITDDKGFQTFCGT